MSNSVYLRPLLLVTSKPSVNLPLLSEKDYADLCRCCDAILNAPGVTEARIAIPWLHVIRPHPMFLKYYRHLFADKQLPSPFSRLYKKARQLTGHLVNLVKAFYSYREPWNASHELPEQIDVLIVSHLVSERQAGDSIDFYFGSLPENIRNSNLRVVVALINFTGQSAKDLSLAWKYANVPRIIFGKALSFSKELALAFCMTKEAWVMRKLVCCTDSDIARKVAVQAALEANSSGTRWALRTADQIANLVKTLSPGAVVLTHEGHSWERVAFAAVRDVNPGTLCIAYQHATISYRQHAVRRNLAPKFNPDLILTSGKSGAYLLRKDNQRQPKKVEVLGSPRAPSHSKDDTQAPQETDKIHRAACLVLPEGDLDECNYLFEFSIECAKLFPDIQFLWRLHPTLSHQVVSMNNPKLRELPANVVLSNDSIESDIAKSFISLYRGTTAIIPAVMSGVFPIYVKKENEISIDTLWQLNADERCIGTTAQFQRLVLGLRSDDPQLLTRITNCAQDICRSLLNPLDPTKFIEIFHQQRNAMPTPPNVGEVM